MRIPPEIFDNVNLQLTDTALEVGLVGRWGLDEGLGTSVGDSTANDLSGQIVGSNWAWTIGAPFDITDPNPPPQGTGGLELLGTDAYVTFGNPTQLGLNTFTLELWFKWNGGGSTASTGIGGKTAIPLLTKGRGESDANNRDMNFFLGIDPVADILVADFEEDGLGSSPGLNHPISGSTSVTIGVWHHAAATYDGAEWRLYLDGALDSTLTVGEPPRADSIQHAGLGTALDSSGSPSGFFDGPIDEVRIWDHARTATEIFDNVNLQLTDTALEVGLVGRWGLDEGLGTSVGDSTANDLSGQIVGSNWAWTIGAPFDIPDPALNAPPETPVLVAPADGEIDVSTSPTLEVFVSDPDGDDLAVEFHASPATAPFEDFTIIVLPDTQHYSSSLFGGSPAIFEAQTQWIADNTGGLNIAFVTHLGDIVYNGDDVRQEWIDADNAMRLIEDPSTTGLVDGIPFGMAVGNHDQGPPWGSTGVTRLYNEYFGEARFLGREYYGGHQPNAENKNDNHFELFRASGMDFLVVHLEFDDTNLDVNGAALEWADGILKTFGDRRAILVQHYLIGPGNPASFSPKGRVVYDALKDNPNLFLMLSAHATTEGRREDTFNGSTVHTLLSNYQFSPNPPKDVLGDSP